MPPFAGTPVCERECLRDNSARDSGEVSGGMRYLRGRAQQYVFGAPLASNCKRPEVQLRDPTSTSAEKSGAPPRRNAGPLAAIIPGDIASY